LAAISENKLYGGNNLHNRALIDQWLDITACDLEATVAAVAIAKDGREVDVTKVIEDVNKFLTFVNNHLNGKKFLVGEELSIADISLATSVSVLLTSLYGE
jgi:glutathione S-transferase